MSLHRKKFYNQTLTVQLLCGFTKITDILNHELWLELVSERREQLGSWEVEVSMDDDRHSGVVVVDRLQNVSTDVLMSSDIPLGWRISSVGGTGSSESDHSSFLAEDLDDVNRLTGRKSDTLADQVTDNVDFLWEGSDDGNVFEHVIPLQSVFLPGSKKFIQLLSRSIDGGLEHEHVLSSSLD